MLLPNNNSLHMDVRSRIKLFEKIESFERPKSIHKEKSLDKGDFENFAKISIGSNPGVHKEFNELESKVSVRSLVCNFQKLVDQATPKKDNFVLQHDRKAQFNKKYKTEATSKQPSPSIRATIKSFTSMEEDIKLFKDSRVTSSVSEISHSYVINQQPSYLINVKDESSKEKPEVSQSESSILDSNKVAQNLTENTNNSVDSTSTKHDFISNLTLSDEEELSHDFYSDEPLNDIISPLPDSYEQLSYEKGHLELKLPPPPKKSCIKVEKTNKNKTVNFNDAAPTVIETYNLYEYNRADELLDILASTAEYEFEKTVAEWNRHEVIITKEKGQRLGLQVYGLGIKKPNSRDCLAIYVKNVAPESPCAKTQNIFEDDLILELNGVSLVGVTIPTVNEAIRDSENQIRMVLARNPVSNIIQT